MPAPAGGLAGVTAHATANRGERIGLAGVPVRFFVPPLSDERHVPPRLRVHRTRLHAGEVGLQPIEIDEL